MGYRALLWDNDGVLVDTERLYFAATRAVLARVGVDLTAALYHDLFLVRSGGAWHLAAERGLSEAEIALLREERNARYAALLETEPLAIAGVEEALRQLRPHFLMGVVTSSRRDHFAAIHRRTGFLEHFAFTLTIEDYARSKPAPDPYLAAVARAGVPPAACLAIEDTPRGLAAATAAGLDCWIVPSALTRRADFPATARVLAGVSGVTAALLGG